MTMKRLVLFVALIFPSLLEAQRVVEAYGTPSNNNCVVYDAAVDNRPEWRSCLVGTSNLSTAPFNAILRNVNASGQTWSWATLATVLGFEFGATEGLIAYRGSSSWGGENIASILRGSATTAQNTSTVTTASGGVSQLLANTNVTKSASQRAEIAVTVQWSHSNDQNTCCFRIRKDTGSGYATFSQTFCGTASGGNTAGGLEYVHFRFYDVSNAVDPDYDIGWFESGAGTCYSALQNLQVIVYDY